MVSTAKNSDKNLANKQEDDKRNNDFENLKRYEMIILEKHAA